MAPLGQAAGLALLIALSGSAVGAAPATATAMPVQTQSQAQTQSQTQTQAPTAEGPAGSSLGAQTGMTLQLQEDLAQLGYLPVGWNGQAFTFPVARMPASLRSLFRPGVYTVLLRGAELSYEATRGLPASLGASLLLAALQQDVRAGRLAPQAYTWVYVDETVPERLTVWSAKGVLASVPANTGVAGAPTPLGTFPVYLRLPYQVMRGRDLGGSAYTDPVYYISYFHGGDAVHGFSRASYGFPQSLGCVEVPPWDAAAIYSEIQIGTLVTVGKGTLAYVATPAPLPAADAEQR